VAWTDARNRVKGCVSVEVGKCDDPSLSGWPGLPCGRSWAPARSSLQDASAPTRSATHSDGCALQRLEMPGMRQIRSTRVVPPQPPVPCGGAALIIQRRPGSPLGSRPGGISKRRGGSARSVPPALSGKAATSTSRRAAPVAGVTAAHLRRRRSRSSPESVLVGHAGECSLSCVVGWLRRWSIAIRAAWPMAVSMRGRRGDRRRANRAALLRLDHSSIAAHLSHPARRHARCRDV
jgi:hypothetical protein